MAPWRLAGSLVELRDEVNARWPNRSKVSDGTIGDAAHAATWSDHNPTTAGVVCAFDITHDPVNGPDGSVLSELFRSHPHPDVKYVIWNRRIFSAYPSGSVPPFTWRAYTGADPHTSHVHVSVGVGPDGRSVEPYDDASSWLTFDPQPGPTPFPQPQPGDPAMQLFTFCRAANSTIGCALLSDGRVLHVDSYGATNELLHTLGWTRVDYAGAKDETDGHGGSAKVWAIEQPTATLFGLPV